MPESSVDKLLALMERGGDINLTPAPPRYGFFEGFARRREFNRLWQSEGLPLLKSIIEDHGRAVHQKSTVNDAADTFTQYTNASGTRDIPGVGNQMLRQMAENCEPATAIINTIVRYAVAYCKPPVMKRGYAKKPGFRIRMSVPEEEATPEDKRNMAELTRYMLNCGYARPPRDERPVNWQHGLKAFVAQITRDSFTIDGVAIQRWGNDKIGPDGKPTVPVMAFAAQDAACIRKVMRPIKEFKDGVAVTSRWKGERTNHNGRPITHVRTANANNGAQTVQEYTPEELVYAVRNPRTDINAQGYGESELERCVQAISIWVMARTYNSSRFSKDSLPRGVLTILGQLDEQQFKSFRLNWQQLLSGQGHRWFNPLLKGSAQQGSSVVWTPIDPSPREMEYHQFMYSVALWIHAIFGMHAEESGWEGMSPFRPPLSEASPETKLESSQNKVLAPYLAWLEDVLNEEIIWKVRPDQRYCLEFVGLGQGDEMADMELRGAMLTYGLSTPRRMLAEMDEPVPDDLKDDPCMDMLGTWAANHMLLLQMDAAKMQQTQQKQQMQQADEQHTQQMAADQLQQAQQPGMPGGPGQGGFAGGGQPPPGASGAEQFAPKEPGQPGADAFSKALMLPWDGMDTLAIERLRLKTGRFNYGPLSDAMHGKNGHHDGNTKVRILGGRD